MGNVTMKAKDTLAAALAECFVTIGDRRYNFMQAINLEGNSRKTRLRFRSSVRLEKEIRQPVGKEPVPVRHIITPVFSGR